MPTQLRHQRRPAADIVHNKMVSTTGVRNSQKIFVKRSESEGRRGDQSADQPWFDAIDFFVEASG